MDNSFQRIAILVPNCNPGGTERVCQRIANYLFDSGYPVIVISMANRDFPFSLRCGFERLDGDDISQIKFQRWRHRINRLHFHLEKHEVSAILSMGEYPNFLLAFLSSKYRRINRYTNSTIALSGVKGLIIKAALRFAYRCTDATIVPVMRLAQELGLQQQGGKIVVMPNPLDLNEICGLGAHSPTPLGHAEDPFFIHVGQLVEQKDHDSLLHAYARYRIEGGRYRLLLLGQGDSEERIRSLILQLELKDSAVLMGWVDNPLAFIARARALIMTSRWEGTPNVMIEAMALGCPIISTDCPTGPREVLQDGTAGRLVPLDDQSALVEELHHMDKDDQWRDKWSEQARQRANDYSINYIGPKLKSILFDRQ